MFVLSLIALALAGFFWRPAWLGLGAMVGLYMLIQLIAAIRISLKQEDLKLAAGIVLATITMHLSWGIALIAGLFSTPDRK